MRPIEGNRGDSSRSVFGRSGKALAFLATLALLLVLAPSLAFARSEVEANNIPGQADFVSDGYITGSIGYPGDMDCASFYCVAGTQYTCYTAGTPGDPTLTLYDPWGAQIGYDDDSGDGLEAMISFNAEYTGRYVVATGEYQNDSTISSYTTYITPMTSENRAPSASGGSFSVNEDGSYSGWVSGSDPDGNPLSFYRSSNVAHGSLTFGSNGYFTYTPYGNYNGSDSFSFYVSDGSLNSGVAWINISVNQVLDPPVGAGDSYTTNEDIAYSGNVLSNDYDYDGGTITVALYAAPQHGALTLNNNGTFTYTPASNYYGADSFQYRPYENGQYGNVTTVSFTVNSVNDRPVAVNDSATCTEDRSVLVPAASGLLVNDSDVDNDALVIGGYNFPAHGTLIIQADGSYLYTPDADFFGIDSFAYEATDRHGLSAWGTCYVTVNGTPDAPVSKGESYPTNEDTPLTVTTAGPRGKGVLANDIDVDLEPLTALLVTDVEHGELTLNADGSFTYVPDENWFGEDSFEYNPYDGALHGITVTVNLTVSGVNDKPVAETESYVTDEDVALTVDAAGVLANDSDPVEGSALTASLVSGVSHGTLVLDVDGGFTYTPAADFHGTDSFTYRASDGSDFSNAVTVDLDVASVNDAPTAVADSYTTDEDETLSVSEGGVLSNDSDVDRDALVAELVDGVSHGTLQFNADGTFVYAPDADRYGTDSFTYRVSDGAEYSKTVTVEIDVKSVNDAPVAAGDAYATDEDIAIVTEAADGVLANDNDPVEGSPLTASLVDTVSHGTLVLHADGSFNYRPAANWHGTDSFTYRVSDGSDFSSTVTVELTVDSVNDAPAAAAETYTTSEDAPLMVAAPGVLVNDSDPVEGSALTAELVADVSHGTLDLNADGSFAYAPDANYNGDDSFTYRAFDGSDYSPVVTVTLHVTSVYDPPVAVEDTYTAYQDETLLIGSADGLLANDLGDGPLSVLSWHDSDQGTAGTVTCWGDGRLKYVPKPGFYGADTFVYRITDGTNISDYRTVTINVAHVNHPPVATEDWAFSGEDEMLSMWGESNLLMNDSDPDGDVLSAVLVSDVEHGTLVLEPNGDYTYTPDKDWSGEDSFTYVANDGQYDSLPVTVHITVYAINDTPIVSSRSFGVDEDGVLMIEAPGMLEGAYDIEGDSFVARVIDGPSHGTVQYGADGGFTYTPDKDFNGTDSFTFRGDDAGLEPRFFMRPVEDPHAGTITIEVAAVNDAPSFTAGGDVTVDEDSGAYSMPWASDISAGPVDEAGQALSFDVQTSDPALFSEQPAIAADGTLTFVPAADAFGAATVSVTLADDGSPAASCGAEFQIAIKAVNDAPLATGDSGRTDEDVRLIVGVDNGVLSNDIDIDSEGLVVELVSDAEHGSLTLDANGGYTYTPVMDWYGEDSFTYRAFDGDAYSAPVTVSLTVDPVNDAPVAAGDAFDATEDQMLVIEGKGSLLSNDSDVEGDDLEALLVDDAAHGSLALSADGSFTYTPDADFNGADSFTYKVTDGDLESGVVTVDLSVAAVNDAPVAYDDRFNVNEDEALTAAGEGRPLDNDTDVDGDELTAALVSSASHGELVFNEDSSFTYTPDKDFYGTDSFTYVVGDRELDSGIATVEIAVAPVNDAPAFTGGDDVTVAEDSGAFSGAWASDMFPGPKNEGDQNLHFAVEVSDAALFAEAPAVAADGTLAFKPAANANGSADCTVTLLDDGSPALSDSAAFTIVVTPINDAPAGHGDSFTIAEDGTLVVAAAQGVLANDTDDEGDALTAAVVQGPAHGSLTLGTQGGFTYTPSANFNGADSFTYRVSDGALDSAPIRVDLTVAPVNDAPVATGDAFKGAEDTQLTVAAPGVLDNDSDLDGDRIAAALVTDVAHGTLSLAGDGSFTYTPASGWSGTDTFTYRVADGATSSAAVTVALDISAVNDGPSATADSFDAVSGVTLTADAAHGVLANDTDSDSESLTAALVTGPAHGTLDLHADGSFSYVPAAGFSGHDSFAYRASDGAASSEFVTVALTVSPPSPTAVSFGITSTTKTRLKWSRSAGATGYAVYRNGALVKAFGSTETSYTFGSFLGPISVIEVRATGADGTQSSLVRAAYVGTTSVKMETIKFAGGVSTLTTAEKSDLRKLAAKIAAQGFKTVTVNGYTRKVQTSAYRTKLSLARANAVKSYLAAQFKSLHAVVTIKAYGKGAADPVGGDPYSYANHRAVVIVR